MRTEGKSIWRTVAGHVTLVGAYVRANLQGALEFRASFISQIAGMIINDSIWIVFWSLYFTRFPVVEGWQRQDVLLLWAIAAVAFGLAMGVFGNLPMLSTIIAEGQLDYYLALPKNVLVHSLVSRMVVSAWGDVIFGFLVFLIFGDPTPTRAVLFLSVSVLAGIVFAGAWVAYHSLTFAFGSAETLAFQMGNALIHFATYPVDLFSGVTRVLLFTLLPAGFITGVPVAVMRSFSWPVFGGLAAAAATAMLVAFWAFRRGLRRYESGNLISLRT